MAELNAKKSKLDKEWTSDKVDTLIHHYMFEQSLWNITHSDYSKKDVRQKALAKIQEKALCCGVLIKEAIVIKML